MANFEVFHDSFDKFYRYPFGAVAIEDNCTIRIRIKSSIIPEQVVFIMDDDLSSEIDELEMRNVSVVELSTDETNMSNLMCDKETEFQSSNNSVLSKNDHIYQLEINTGDRPGLLFYCFQIKIDGEVYYYGKEHEGYGGEGRLSREPHNKYQITVYNDKPNRPPWFSESIVYQIFVDRFYNGNPGKEVLNPKKNSLIHSHWDNDPLYIKNEEGHVIRWDFFGGNLLGVREKLSYLKELGISTIYFNPIFQAASNHKYDTGDYHKIDEMFGDNQVFTELVKEAEKMGISIILDGVFSHTGNDSIYFNQYGSYDSKGAYQSQGSPYYNWYSFNNYPDEYESWWGISDLPNVNELELSYQDFIINNEDSVVNYWMDIGVKGWRLDVADELPSQFIKNFKKEMRKNDSDSILIGEVWEDASNKCSYGERREYFLGEELDSVTNYTFRSILIDFILGKISSEKVHNSLMTMAENYPPLNMYSCMNLLGTHDVPRILTELSRDLVDGDKYKDIVSFQDSDKYKSSSKSYENSKKKSIKNEESDRYQANIKCMAIKRLKMLSLWQMTFPGVPCIYYGDEVGLEGETDPDNRRTYPWGNENQEILNWYKKIIKLRNTYDIFKTGEWHSIYFNQDIYAYLRSISKNRDVFQQEKDNNTALILFNRSINQSYDIEINFAEYFNDINNGKQSVYDYLLGEELDIEDQAKRIRFKPLSCKIYISKK